MRFWRRCCGAFRSGGLSRPVRSAPGTAIRTGLWLCAGGEFGFVLLAEMGHSGLVPSFVSQAVLAALVLSMLIAPLIVHLAATAS